MDDIAEKTERAWIEINIENLEHNVKILKSAMPRQCKLMAVVKTAAYGHGACEIAAYLNQMGVTAFAVATIEEGIQLRNAGIYGEILILGYTDVRHAIDLNKYDLMQTLIDYEYARALEEQGVAVKTHLKIDTGMHRLGVPDKNIEQVKEILSMKNINICGMFTHLCCAESRKKEDIAYTRGQIASFYKLVENLKACGIKIPKLHMQSSYGLLHYPELACDYVRAGIALYGALPSEKPPMSYVVSSPSIGGNVLKLDLRPVLSLKCRVVLIRSVKKGESIGYDRCFTAERDSRIAILSVGYGDGFPRSLSGGKTSVLLNQRRAPIIGYICMDMLAVDITDIETNTKKVTVRAVATLIGTGESGVLPAYDVAEHAGSISNELLCRMGARLPVVVKAKP